MVVNTYNPKIREVDAGGLGIQGHPWLVGSCWYEMGIPGQHGLYEILSQKEWENDIFVVTPN